MRTVIFDLDGTLADTSGDLLAAANCCFRQMGLGDVLEHPKDAGLALRGARMMLSEGLKRVEQYDSAVVEEYFPVFIDVYRQSIDLHTVLYPGAMVAVKALKDSGYGVGICTNKPEDLADQLLRCLGVRDDFDSLIGADTLAVRKPDPEPLREAARRAGGDPAKTILIGDTDTDRNTSAAAGVPSILVTFGPSGQNMSALNPEGLLHDFEDLPEMVSRLIG